MSSFTDFYDGYSKAIKETKTVRRWNYTVRRQFGFQHYHVTLFPDRQLKEDLGRLWSNYDIDLTGRAKFNTQGEAEKFIVSVRRALSRRGIKLVLLEKDLAI